MDWNAPWLWSRKASAARRLMALDQIGRPVWSARRYDQFADEGYRKNVIAYRSVGEVAQAAASVPWRLYRRRGDSPLAVEQHPLLELLERPNPLQGGPALFEALFAYRLIAGNAFLEAVAPQGRPPVELHSLRPDRMRIIPGRTGLPATYRYTVGGRERDFPVDQVSGRSAILHFKAFHRLRMRDRAHPLSARCRAAARCGRHRGSRALLEGPLQHARGRRQGRGVHRELSPLRRLAIGRQLSFDTLRMRSSW